MAKPVALFTMTHDAIFMIIFLLSEDEVSQELAWLCFLVLAVHQGESQAGNQPDSDVNCFFKHGVLLLFSYA
jgi:hypothetical protein